MGVVCVGRGTGGRGARGLGVCVWRGRGRCGAFIVGQLFGLAVEDELEALDFVGGIGGVVFGDGVRGTQGFGLVDGAHVLSQRIGARERAVAFCCGLVVGEVM